MSWAAGTASRSGWSRPVAAAWVAANSPATAAYWRAGSSWAATSKPSSGARSRPLPVTSQVQVAPSVSPATR